MVGGEHAHAKIVILAVGRELDPAVLRAAAFCDIQLGEDFDAGKNGTEETAGRVVSLHEPAVDAVANPHAILKRLDMNVAGAEHHGLGDDEVDEFHHRRVGRVVGILIGRLLDGRFREIDRRVGEFLEHGVGTLAVAGTVVTVDRLHDLLSQRKR